MSKDDAETRENRRFSVPQKSEGFFREIKLHILKKLFDQRCWIHKHFNINNIQQGLPPHKRDSRIIKKAVDELIKNKWLLSKPTHYGLELSLNIANKKEIEEYIEKKLFT